MNILRSALIVVALALPAVACGGKASDEQCAKAADNLVNIQIAEVMKQYPDATDEMKKAGEDAARKNAEGSRASFLETCKQAPADAVDCIANSADMAAFGECQKKFAN